MMFSFWPRGAAISGCGIVLAMGCAPDSRQAGSSAGQAVQVVVAEAAIQDVQETLPLVGSIVANEQVEIKSEIDGTVEAILFSEGEDVESGDPLVQLDESKLTTAVEEAEANAKLSAANYERARSLIEDQLISRQEYDQIFAAYRANEASLALKRRQLKDTRIYAPFAGVIGSRMVSPGQVISRNTTLTWLVDLDPVKVEVEAPERFLGQLKVGQSLDVAVAAFPGKAFTGEVFFIAPFVDPAMRTALVKARIPNPEGELLPGMFANIELTLQIRSGSVVVPEESISQLLDDGRATLFVKDRTDTARLTQVKLGMRLPGRIEILEGLKGGEEVIVQGIQKLAPGAKVRVGPPSPADSAEAAPPPGQPGGKETKETSVKE